MEKIKPYTLLVLIIFGLLISFSIGYYIPTGKNRELASNISALEGQLTSLQSDLTNRNDIISDLESDTENLENQLETIQSEINIRETEILELQKYVPPSTNKAPEFTVTGISGETFNLADHLGEVVVIDFMATWCGYCGSQVDEYIKLREEFGDNIVVLSISVDPTNDSDESLDNYSNQYNASWIWAVDNQNITELYEAQRIPTTIIIDKNGYIWTRYVGFTDSNILGVEIEQILSYWGSYDIISNYVSLSVLEAKELIDQNPELLILDVRTDAEFNSEHLENAVNVPLDELDSRLGELVSGTILVYCKSGIRSAEASQILVDNGFTEVYNMEGGIMNWMNTHLPVVITP